MEQLQEDFTRNKTPLVLANVQVRENQNAHRVQIVEMGYLCRTFSIIYIHWRYFKRHGLGFFFHDLFV